MDDEQTLRTDDGIEPRGIAGLAGLVTA